VKILKKLSKLKQSLMLISMSALLVVSITNSAYALDIKSALSEDAVMIYENVNKHLGLELTDKGKLNFHESFFKSYVQNGWNLKPVSFNSALVDSKVNDNKVKFVNYILSYKERTLTMNLIHYPEQKQVISSISEIVPVSPSNVLKFYADRTKEDSGWDKVFDTDDYSMFQQDGRVQYVNYHISGDNATVIYSYSNVFNY
jgi:hypothetical protein